MSSHSRRKIWLHRALWSLLALAMMYVAVGSFVSNYYKRLVLTHLPALAAKATDSLYDITVQDIDVNILTRAVTVTGLRMSVNLKQVQRLRAAGRPPRVILDVTVPEATVRGVHWRDLKNEREIGCKQVVFFDPEIRIQLMPGWNRERRVSKGRPAMISRVFAKQIHVQNPQFDLRYSYGTDGFVLQSQGGDIQADDWDFHPQQAFDSNRFFAARQARVQLDHINFQAADALYRFYLGSLGFRTKQSLLSFRDFRMEPIMPADSVYARLGHRKTLINLTIPALRLEGFQWKGMLSHERALLADRLLVDTPQISCFLNKRPPPNMDSSVSYFPQHWLKELKIPLRIPVLQVWDGSLDYNEANALTGATGNLSFSYLRGYFFNLSNMPPVWAKQPECWMSMSGNFANRGLFTALARFRLNSPKDAFSCSVLLRDLDAGDIRDPVNALAMADLKSLKLSSARVDLAGNTDSLWGDARIRYAQLRLRLKKWIASDSTMRGRPLLNFIANNLLLYEANPMPGEPLRQVDIGLSRGAYRSFFQFVWKGMAQACVRTAIREGGAYDLAMRRKEAKGKPRQKFFKDLFPKRADSIHKRLKK
ncbi:MAG: hypothetical protein JST06_11005 [Bacteroidetes bacterium]|nr:hypothetical protein [Bacteroidota bacterium]MBS1630769.1 hypothetical protein [Bacteroidota bacterium]